MKQKLEKTCANRFLGRCEGCDRDYDAEKHPNNYDCENYRELHYVCFSVGEDPMDYVSKWVEEMKE